MAANDDAAAESAVRQLMTDDSYNHRHRYYLSSAGVARLVGEWARVRVLRVTSYSATI